MPQPGRGPVVAALIGTALALALPSPASAHAPLELTKNVNGPRHPWLRPAANRRVPGFASGRSAGLTVTSVGPTDNA